MQADPGRVLLNYRVSFSNLLEDLDHWMFELMANYRRWLVGFWRIGSFGGLGREGG